MTRRNEQNSLDVGVIGVGSMGQHHARVYSELPGANLIGVYDIDEARASEVATERGTNAIGLEDLLMNAEAVSVAVPTRYHVEMVEQCIEHGVHVLVEKPIVDDRSDGERLIHAAADAGVTIQVGHIERFNPAIIALQDIVTDLDVIAINAERLGPPPNREIQDNSIVDLMIHDLDIVLSLIDELPDRIEAVGTRQNDHSSALLEFPSGVVSSLTASRRTHRKVRRIEVFAEESYVEVDYIDPSIDIYRRSIPEYIEDDGNIRYRYESIIEKPSIGSGEPLKNELESFVNTILEDGVPEVTARDGLRAVLLANELDRRTNESITQPLEGLRSE